MSQLTVAYSDLWERLSLIIRGLLPVSEAFSTTENGAKIWRNNEWFTFENEAEINFFNFDKTFADLTKVFEYCGFRSVSTKLQTGKIVRPRNDETEFSEGWFLTPAVVKSVANSLEKVSLEILLTKWNAAQKKELKTSGLDIGNFDDLFLPNVESLKNFLNQSALRNDYLLILQ